MNRIYAPGLRRVMLVVMSKARESDAAVRWRKIVRGHADSGLSVAAYCRRTRVPQASFFAWRRKLRDAATFAEVRLIAPPSGPERAERGSASDGALEVHLPHGRRVLVRPGFDRRTLLALVTTLEQGVAGAADEVADGARRAHRGTDVAPVSRRGARP
jgi:transposase-like protein